MKRARIDALDPHDEGHLRAFRSLDRAGSGSPAPPPGGATLLVARRDEPPLARASIRVVEGLARAPGRTGVIGHYEARDADAGVALLRESLARLGEADVDRVVGPMDGTTWDRYRLALPRDRGPDPAPFLSEPTNPPEYPAHFEAAGLRPVERYVSQEIRDLGALEERTREAAAGLRERGIRLVALDPARFDEALAELYRLSRSAFADNPYYSPIGLDRFRTLYEPMEPVLDPELVLIARGPDDDAVGFVLAFPDLLDPAGRPTRVIVKSLAVEPDRRGLGLGSVLVHEVHRRAAERGYRSAIHALTHVDNDSRRIGDHGGAVFRQYALYGWTP